VAAHGPVHEQIAAATRSIEENPADAVAWLRRGELYRISGEWRAAAADYDQAERIDPDLPEIALCRGSLLLDSREQEAIALFDCYLEERPADWEAYRLRSRALRRLLRDAEAIDDMDRAIALAETPTPELYIERANVVLGVGKQATEPARIAEAIRGIDEGIERLGPIASLEYVAIALEQRRGAHGAALARLDLVGAQMENKSEYVERRRQILLEAGRLTEDEGAPVAPKVFTCAFSKPLGPPRPLPPMYAVRPASAGSSRAAPAASPRGPASVAAIPLPRNSTWRYDATGMDLGTAWREVAYDDASWPSGAAALGYGDAFIATTVPFGPDPNSKYTTTYFRTTFSNTQNPSSFATMTLSANYDDGFAAYLNGIEIARQSLAAGATYGTFASLHEGGSYESIDVTAFKSALVVGANVLAVEVHQANGTSSDLAMDMELSTSTQAAAVVRGPYLQVGTPTSVVVRWRTDVATDSRVSYGAAVGSLTSTVDDPALTTEHVVTVSGLAPDTKYFYAVGTTAGPLAGDDANHFVVTSPPADCPKPTRVWILGDSGVPGANQNNVRDAYYSYAGATPTDLWLMLGDNAYNTGTDAEYQAGLFVPYQAMLRKSVLWPTRGNHDAIHAGANNDYYDIFSMPTAGEAGGMASGSEAYYSFDYGNIHFVCLDSEGTDRSPAGPMMTWLRSDLGATTKDWTIAFWHHPPYTKGSHDSDNDFDSAGRMRDMRENALPILDTLGVDLVLAGHSHSYERSFLLNGHYGNSSTLVPSMILDAGDGRESGSGAYGKLTLGAAANQGAVYAVAGSSAQTSGGALNHPAMFVSLNVLGSMVIDIAGNRLDARFLTPSGVSQDSFTVIKGPPVDVGEGHDGALAPWGLSLAPARPSPFATQTRFEFSLPRASAATLSVFDAAGRRVATVASGACGAGAHVAVWDGRSERGSRVGPGVYFGVLESGGETRRSKVVLLK
jgi:hypothetical protein